MGSIANKIDFAVIINVKNANPNGDPLNGNRPRVNYDGHGEISDVCIKRKIRNRIMMLNEVILVQSDDNRVDEYRSIKARVESVVGKIKDADKLASMATEAWYDVRAFGQVFAFKGVDVSVGVRGPVSIHTAVSLNPINITSMQIVKSVNSVDNTKDINKKTEDTMGLKHRVDNANYIFYGSINPQLAKKTGFSDADAEKLKQALITLFENDASSARPEGSMEVHKVYWWSHNCESGQYSSAKVHRSLKIALNEAVSEPKSIEDYMITTDDLPDLIPQVYEGK